MATQNFLAGGYYGKLGDTVGQRWHNKRIIRSYVIPEDPKTPAQQAQRGIFKTGTRLAQEAFNINKGHSSWDTTAKGEFMLRVSTAVNRLKRGLPENEALPLYPDGYSPNIEIEGGAIDYSRWANRVSLTTAAPAMTEPRSFELAIWYKSWRTDQWEFKTVQTNVLTGGLLYLDMFIYEGYCFPSGSYIEGASNDDASHGGISIFMPAVSILNPSPLTMPVGLLFGAPVNSGFNTWQLPVSFQYPVNMYAEIEIEIRAWNTDSGAWDTQHTTAELNGEGQSFVQLETGDEFSYPSGSQVNAGLQVEEYDDFKISYSWNNTPFTIP